MSETIITKTCSKCKQVKNISEFYPRKDRPGCFRPWCKDCCHKDNISDKSRKCKIKYAQSDIGKITQKRYQKLYCTSEKGRESSRKRGYRYHHSVKGIARRKAYQQTNKYKARLKVCGAVLAGNLPNIKTQTCKCGKQAEHYHHPSYAPEHWLDVVSLCQDCHFAIHFNS